MTNIQRDPPAALTGKGASTTIQRLQTHPLSEQIGLSAEEPEFQQTADPAWTASERKR
jgi:hypothetical protein